MRREELVAHQSAKEETIAAKERRETERAIADTAKNVARETKRRDDLHARLAEAEPEGVAPVRLLTEAKG